MFILNLKRVLISTALTAVAALTLVGCGDEATPSPVPPATTQPTTQPTAEATATVPLPTATSGADNTPAPQPTAAPEATPTSGGSVFINYTRSGGFIGDNTNVVIDAEGNAIVTSTRLPNGNAAFKIEAGLWQQIQKSAGSIDWANLKDDYGMGAPADAFDYLIKYSSGAINKTVHTYDSGGAPDEVLALINLLNKVIDQSQQGTATSTPVAPTNAALLVYHLSGGIAGFDTYLFLTPDGHAFVSTNRPPGTAGFAVDPDLWARIGQAIGDVDWTNLQDKYEPANVVADGMFYEVTYFGADSFKTVASETSSEVPAELQNLYDLLGQVISAAGTASVATPAPTPGLGKGLLLLDYRVTGGITGNVAHAYVLNDGSIWVSNTRPANNVHFTLMANRWTAIRSTIEAFNWNDLNSSYNPATPVADALHYQLTYLGTDGHRTIESSTGGDTPLALQQLLDMLQATVNAGG